MIDAVDSIKIDPTSMSNTYKVFDNLHMLWMCIWMCPYKITAALVDQAFGSLASSRKSDAEGTLVAHGAMG